MLKIGVFGVGHLGKIHISILKRNKNFELVGFYDSDKVKTKEVEKEFGIKAFSDPDELISAVDAVDIVTNTIAHYNCAVDSIKKTKHVFIEKPLTYTVEEAASLIKFAQEANVKIQVGHVERFNPAFNAAKSYIQNPMFIETHRLALFNPRGTDVSVVLDLMIHDIDIVLSTVKSNVKKISASGVSIVSSSPDIANARLEFDNGCVANLTASRISLKNMRKSRFFQKDAYISVDFLDKKTEVIRITDVLGEPDPLAINVDLGEGRGIKQINIEKPEVVLNNAIEDELNSFFDAIVNDKNPLVSAEDGFNALNVAHAILDKMKTTVNQS
ncbi:MAG TPA: oxidoreductase [Bacteroidales bacterium]|nr:MAG: oxidoreductase [Bacteroidetes bacterium GWF2_33_38]HBF87455.1 oxidoreductase [Bacteroidales bacterium]